jgi:hypothetical protein
MNFARIGVALCVASIFAMTGQSLQGQAGTGLPWTSNFETGNFSEWNGGYRSTDNLIVTESGCFSGRCARTDIVPGTVGSNYADKHFGDWFSLGGTKVEEIWLRFYSKFSSGLVWPNRSQKMAIFNLTNGVDNERRYQVYVYVTPSGRYAVDHSDIGNWQFYGLSQNVGAPVGPRGDEWDKIKLYVRLNSPGRSDGIVRMWVNDELKLQHTNVPIRASSSYGMNKLILSNSATQLTVSTGYQWWDSWSLSATDPDGGGGTTLPAVPTNVRIIR